VGAERNVARLELGEYGVRRSDQRQPRQRAERFIEEVRGDDPEVAAKLRVEERELEAGGLN